MKTFLFLLVFTSAAARAAEPSVRAICASPASETETSRITRDLFERFATEDFRRANTEDYLASLDLALTSAGFADVLACRARTDYRLAEAKADESMRVEATFREDGSVEFVTLFVKLENNPRATLITYLHELRHVCHKVDEQHLTRELVKAWNEEGSKSARVQAARDEILRASLIAEVEAFHLGYRAYATFAAAGVRELCEGRRFELFAFMEDDLDEGRFAQVTLTAYVDPTAALPAVFKAGATPRRYEDKSTGTSFEMPALREDLVSRIRALGIEYREPL